MSSDVDDGSVRAAVREVKTAMRSRQILLAAARLMARNGSEAMSMHALAEEAGVSVGLIYRYFGGKDELLLAVIVEVLDNFATEVPRAVAAAGDDPIRELQAAFRAYCEVIDRFRHAAVLTYRESNALSDEGREKIKRLEIETSEPLRAIVARGVATGALTTAHPDLIAYDLLLLAHSWALKHWYFERTLSLPEYVDAQFALVVGAAISPHVRGDYPDLLSRPTKNTTTSNGGSVRGRGGQNAG